MSCDSGTAMFLSVSAEPPIARKASLRTTSRSPNSQPIADAEKRLPLALFGALAVTDVQRRRFVIAGGQRRANARIHAAAEQNHRASLLSVVMRAHVKIVEFVELLIGISIARNSTINRSTMPKLPSSLDPR